MDAIITISAGDVPTFARAAFPLTFYYSPNDRVGHLKTKIQVKIRRFYKARQSLVVKSSGRALLQDDMTLSEADIHAGAVLEVNDLGPQVSWKLVSIFQNMGPFLIHPFFYFLPTVFYGTRVVHSELQNLTFSLIELYYMKRIAEGIFVHRFSRGSVTALQLFKSCLHFYVLGGIVLAFDLYRPVFSATSAHIRGTIRDDQAFLWTCVTLWACFLLANSDAHMQLHSLRPRGNEGRSIPHGFGFNLVSFPNYLFESLMWLTVCIMTGSFAAFLFFTVGTGQMMTRAVKQHRAYKKEFGKDYPPERKAMIPFIL